MSLTKISLKNINKSKRILLRTIKIYFKVKIAKKHSGGKDENLETICSLEASSNINSEKIQHIVNEVSEINKEMMLINK